METETEMAMATPLPPPRNGDHWNCTDGQRDFILRIINESNLTKHDAEELAQQLFGAGVSSSA